MPLSLLRACIPSIPFRVVSLPPPREFSPSSPRLVPSPSVPLSFQPFILPSLFPRVLSPARAPFPRVSSPHGFFFVQRRRSSALVRPSIAPVLRPRLAATSNCCRLACLGSR
eukprot:scaffold76272_cov31-Tisochrysis_lutea.AAC.2